MRSLWPLRIALRLVSRNGTRELRSAILAIGLSLIPLVLVLHVSDGMIRGIVDRFIEAGTYHLQLRPPRGVDPLELTQTAEACSAIDGVSLCAPEVQGVALAYAPGGRAGVTVRGVASGLWEADPGLRRYLEVTEGSFDLAGPRHAVVGVALAERLGITVGQRIRLLTARVAGTGGLLPRVTTLEVVGIASSGYRELDRLWLFIPFATASRILPEASSRSLVGVTIDSPYALENPLLRQGNAAEGQRILGRLRELSGIDWAVYTWFDAERARYMSFITTKNLLLFIMALIVVVASINISSSLVIMVLDRQWEIGILKSTGARPSDIVLLFVSGGFLIGGLGAAVGLLFGVFLSVNINGLLLGIEWLLDRLVALVALAARPFHVGSLSPVDLLSQDFYLETIPIRLALGPLALVAGGTILLATAAALIPALRAASTRPVEALRRH